MCEDIGLEFIGLQKSLYAQHPVSHVHTNALIRIVKILTTTHMPMPRFFYQVGENEC